MLLTMENLNIYVLEALKHKIIKKKSSFIHSSIVQPFMLFQNMQITFIHISELINTKHMYYNACRLYIFITFSFNFTERQHNATSTPYFQSFKQLI